MLRNYFIIAIRNFKKYKVFSLLNIFGLALGIACVVLIYTFISYELSYERCYPNHQRIFRVVSDAMYPEGNRYWAPTAPRLGPELKESIPEIEEMCRVMLFGATQCSVGKNGEIAQKYIETKGFFVDSTIFKVFDFQLLAGTPKQAMVNNTITISDEMAMRYFNKIDVIGERISIEKFDRDFEISGVFESPNGNTHLEIDYMISFDFFRRMLYSMGLQSLYNSPTWAGPYNYVLLKDGVKLDDAYSKMDDFTIRYFNGVFETPEKALERRKFIFQPIDDIHLKSKREQELAPNSDITYVYVFVIVAILILVIAGVNYVNISTAQSMRRVKEIGLRKVIGANKNQIIRQYMYESLIVSFIAALFSVLIIDLFFPFFNLITGLDYSLSQMFTVNNILLIVITFIVIGFLAGAYPAFMASRFSIQDNIKGFKKQGSLSNKLRKGLIVLQFIISVFLIFSTIVIYKQIRLFNEVDLGFEKENILVFKRGNELSNAMRNNYNGVKAEFMSNSLIKNITSTSDLPGERTSVESFIYQAHQMENNPGHRVIRVDEDYLHTMKIELLEGDGFYYSADTMLQFVVNENTKLLSGLDDVLGKLARNNWGELGRIVGVCKNYNFASLHESIEPLVMEYNPKRILSDAILIKYVGDDKSIINAVEKILNKIAPNDVFDYGFLETEWNNLYITEQKASDTFKAFTILAIIISCIGLFGLASFAAQIRIKEMGIRKVHGARLIDIMQIFAFDFLKLIIVAAFLSLPLAWYIMNQWLHQFEYRIEISWVYAFLTLIIVVLVSLITIIYQMIKVSTANPIDYIKYE